MKLIEPLEDEEDDAFIGPAEAELIESDAAERASRELCEALLAVRLAKPVVCFEI